MLADWHVAGQEGGTQSKLFKAKNGQEALKVEDTVKIWSSCD